MRSKFKIVLLLSLLLFSFKSFSQKAFGDSTHVLLLNSYHAQFNWTAEVTRGIEDVFEDLIKPENLHVEYMDSRRFADDSVHRAMLAEVLIYKFRAISPDIIIVSDDFALDFILEFRDSINPKTPIIFCGINVAESGFLSQIDNMTGILEGMSVAENLDLICQLQPKVETIYMLGDKTGLGHKMVLQAKSAQEKWSSKPENSKVEVKILDDFTLEELYELSKNASKEEVFLMLAVHRDREGKYFSYDEEFVKLASVSKVPIYGMWGGLLVGKGVLGGNMNDAYRHGYETGQLAEQVLEGQNINSFPIREKATYTPHFDYQKLIQYKIKFNRLPKDSFIYNQPSSFYRENKRLVIVSLSILLFLLITVIILLFNIRKRKLAERNLAKMNNELSHMVEERTKRLLDSEKLASLGQLTASIAHELNTPLGAIQSSTQSTQNNIVLFMKLLAKVAKEISETDFIMIRQLLDYNKGHFSDTSSSQDRKQRKLIEADLSEVFPVNQNNLSLARDLQQLGIRKLDDTVLQILKSEKSPLILEVAKRTNEILRSNETALSASQKASKVVIALKTYVHSSHEEGRELFNVNLGIETALTILQNQLKMGIKLEKELDSLPKINCFPDELESGLGQSNPKRHPCHGRNGRTSSLFSASRKFY